MRKLLKKHFWVIMFVLYVVAVIGFVAVVYGDRNFSHFSSKQIAFIAIQSLLAGIPPLIFPIYVHIKIKKSSDNKYHDIA